MLLLLLLKPGWDIIITAAVSHCWVVVVVVVVVALASIKVSVVTAAAGFPTAVISSLGGHGSRTSRGLLLLFGTRCSLSSSSTAG